MKFVGRKAVALGVIVAFSVVAKAEAEPRYKLDSANTRVLELSNLSPGGACLPARLEGRVVKRSYDGNGVIPEAVTIEEATGERTFINIDRASLDDVSMVARDWAAKGLQTLLREGQRVSLGVQYCGAAGRVVVLDAVRPARRR